MQAGIKNGLDPVKKQNIDRKSLMTNDIVIDYIPIIK
jgi:hypothetical protein